MAGEPQSAALLTALAHELAPDVTLVSRLLAEHVDDGTGHCRLCSVGSQAGRKLWPCSIRAVAHAAMLMHGER